MSKKQTVTMSDIARKADVSIPTVSYILNGRAEERRLSEDTTNKVLEIAKELGYVPNLLASSLRRNKTQSVGLIVSDLERRWANRLLKGMMEVLDKTGYTTVLSVHFWDPERERQQLMSYMAEKKAAIITRPLPENIDLYKRIIDRGTPLIFLDQLADFDSASYVMWDAREAIRKSIDYLISIGRDRIGYFGVLTGTEEDRQRYQAYRYAIKKRNLMSRSHWIYLDKRYVLEESQEGPKGRVVGYGSALRAGFQSKDNCPNAILASNDALASTCITILRDDLGYRIPEDVAIMGMGDVGESEIAGLSTSREPVEEVGRKTAAAVLTLIENGNKEPIHQRIEHAELSIRSTT